ncbi:hypothetical protein [Pedobacter miscanthi]|uniref:hypothetical protein n=1 Tax=Pedobacter miscanthi TaxID=2259170 RepID=UPI00292EEAB8|nr:hypothetical protein [Pedobacter miscanthi]
MKIGIIAEGHSDRAVISNLLQGILGIEGNDILAILPINGLDETDLANLPKEYFGGWTSVRRECHEREFINPFFERTGENFIVVQIDTAESAQFGVKQPTKDDDYCDIIRTTIISKIRDWMGEDIGDKLLHAIAVEETDAWILTLLETRDSSKSADPKKKLERLKGFKIGKMKPDFKLYSEYSQEFKSATKKQLLTFRSRNRSLDAFCTEIETKALPFV